MTENTTSDPFKLLVQSIVDSSTGQVVASKSVVGVSNKKALNFGYSGAGFSGDVGGFKNDNVGKAVESACGEAVKFMIDQLPKIPWSGTVVQTAGGKVYFSDVGDWSCPPKSSPDVKLHRNEGQSQVSPGDL